MFLMNTLLQLNYTIPSLLKYIPYIIFQKNSQKFIILNSKIEDIVYFELPYNQGNRSLIKIKKEKDNIKYPRKNSDIKKSRL